MSKQNDILDMLVCIAGLVGIGYAISTHSQLVKVSKRLDRSIDEIADNMEIDISEKLVKEAVDRAIQDETTRAVARAANNAVDAVREDMKQRVMSAVNDEYDNLKGQVLKEITDKAARIDVVRVHRSVEEAAKDAALKKFDDNLDDILEKFNSDLNNTYRIYNSIIKAAANNPSSGREFVVRLN